MSTRQAATHVVVKHDQYGGTLVVRCAVVELSRCVAGEVEGFAGRAKGRLWLGVGNCEAPTTHKGGSHCD